MHYNGEGCPVTTSGGSGGGRIKMVVGSVLTLSDGATVSANGNDGATSTGTTWYYYSSFSAGSGGGAGGSSSTTAASCMRMSERDGIVPTGANACVDSRSAMAAVMSDIDGCDSAERG